jgi:hypothetical protein
MSPHTNFHPARTPFSWRIHIGHKSGLLFISSVNIKPPRHRFGFSLAGGWQNTKESDEVVFASSLSKRNVSTI